MLPFGKMIVTGFMGNSRIDLMCLENNSSIGICCSYNTIKTIIYLLYIIYINKDYVEGLL